MYKVIGDIIGGVICTAAAGLLLFSVMAMAHVLGLI